MTLSHSASNGPGDEASDDSGAHDSASNGPGDEASDDSGAHDSAPMEMRL